MPPYPAVGHTRIQLNVRYPAGTDLWGASVWGTATWEAEDTGSGTQARWEDIAGRVQSYQVTWGADDPSGALTVAAAGSWECKIYDPKRELDPANTSSRFAIAMKPGHPIRLRFVDDAGAGKALRVGIIDEVEFDIATSMGTIRGTDSLQLMVAASMLEGQDTDPNMPTTLCAMAKYILQKVGLHNLIPVATLTPDPTVGKPVAGAASAWAHISTAAYDVLHAAWIDKLGTLQFRSFGDPYDKGLQIGGAGGIPVSTIRSAASIKKVYTRVVAYDAAGVRYEAANPDAQAIFGDILLERRKPTPNTQGWCDAVLLDRAGAALQYTSGSIYPVTQDQVQSLIDLNMMDVVHLVADSVSPPFDIPVRVLGGHIQVDVDSGWTFELYNYIPANEWDEITELPPDIEEPPPDPEEPPVEPPPVDETMKVTRWYNCTKDSGIGITGSTKAGQGADTVLAVGNWSGWKFRALMDFDDPSWADVISVDKASIEVTNSDQDTVGFGSSPKVTLRRITESWTQGSSDTMHTSNAVVWPGPASTSTGAKTSGTLSRTEGATYLLDCTAIVRAWFQGNVKRGIEARSYGEDNTTYTIEWVSSEGASPPRLKLELTVHKP